MPRGQVKAPWPRQGVFKITEVFDVGWMVPSRSNPGAYWYVTWHTAPNDGVWFECGCPAGRERGPMGPRHAAPCRHVRLVGDAERADGYPPRPSAPVNRSAIVD